MGCSGGPTLGAIISAAELLKTPELMIVPVGAHSQDRVFAPIADLRHHIRSEHLSERAADQAFV
jgi:hypothetical protein